MSQYLPSDPGSPAGPAPPGAPTAPSASPTSGPGPSPQGGAHEVIDGGQRAVGDAVNRAREAAAEVKDQAKVHTTSLLAEQKERAVESLATVARAVRQTGQELRKQDQNAVGRYADSAAQQVERAAAYLRTRDVPDLLDDLQDLARHQSALFLGTALALGALGARFLMSTGQRTARPARALRAAAVVPERFAVSGAAGMVGDAGPIGPGGPMGPGAPIGVPPGVATAAGGTGGVGGGENDPGSGISPAPTGSGGTPRTVASTPPPPMLA